MAYSLYKGGTPLIQQPKFGSSNAGRIYLGTERIYGAEPASFIPSFSPYAYYDATNADSYDATNKNWSDLALVNTTDDSTFDTEVSSGEGKPTHNSNGYWEIRSNQSTNRGQGFRYGTTTSTTNPFSFLTTTSHTIITYVRLLTGDTDNDIIGSGVASGAVLMGGYGTGVPTRGHVWATSVKTVDTPTGLGNGNWGVMGQRFRLDGSNTRISSFYCSFEESVVIANGSTFTPGTPTSSPYEIAVGGRGGHNNEVRGNFDICGYALYRTELSDSEIQDVADEMFAQFGEPT